MLSLSRNGERITGAIVEHKGQQIEVVAAKGVVLAAGGFEHNQALRDEGLPKPSKPEWSVSQTNNTGDAIKAARELGAKSSLMEHGYCKYRG